MAKRHSRTMLAFGDVHVPHQNPRAVDVFCRAAERLRPDLIICLSDLLDCGQFSTHPPTFGVPETEYVDDLRGANGLLDRLQRVCDRLVMVEGNHEYRLDRWAAVAAEGRGVYSMPAPRYPRRLKCNARGPRMKGVMDARCSAKSTAKTISDGQSLRSRS